MIGSTLFGKGEQPENGKGVLSSIATVYDPLGFASPLLLPGRAVNQELCKLKFSWNHTLPEELCLRWRKWREDLMSLQGLNIPRCFKPEGFSRVTRAELHHFAYASQQHIPHSRGLEIRTLEVVREKELGDPFTAGQFRNRNIALPQRYGGVTIHIQLYKTRRFMGHDQIELQVSQAILDLANPRCRDTACLEIRNEKPSNHFYPAIRPKECRFVSSASSTVIIPLIASYGFACDSICSLYCFQVGSELCRLLRQYVQEFRPELCWPERTGRILFLVGFPFDALHRKETRLPTQERVCSPQAFKPSPCFQSNLFPQMFC